MNIQGFSVKKEIYRKELYFIGPILEEWARVNRDIRKRTDRNDNWSNERAHLSSLAGAIWKCGGIAIEEYSSPKGERNSLGRTDLLFKIDNRVIICEAKRWWLYLPHVKNNKDYKKEINGSFEYKSGNSMADIKHTLSAKQKEGNTPDFGLAIDFFMPFWKSTQPEKHPGQLERLKDQLDQVDCDFYIYLECTGHPPLSSERLNEAWSTVIMTGRIATPSP